MKPIKALHEAANVTEEDKDLFTGARESAFKVNDHETLQDGGELLRDTPGHCTPKDIAEKQATQFSLPLFDVRGESSKFSISMQQLPPNIS